MSVRKAIELGQFSHGGWYAKSQARDQSAMRRRIREIAQTRPHVGYQRIHVMLRREGLKVNRKRVCCWYRFEGLQISMCVRRRTHMSLHRGPVPRARCTYGRWSMDFVHDRLFGGSDAFAALTGRSNELARRCRSQSITARSSRRKRLWNRRIGEA